MPTRTLAEVVHGLPATVEHKAGKGGAYRRSPDARGRGIAGRWS